MENLKKYLPKALFFSFGLKSLILNQNWITLAAFGVSACAFLVTEYLNNKKEVHLFEKKLVEQQEQLKRFEDKLDKFADSLGTLQVARGFKPVSIK